MLGLSRVHYRNRAGVSDKNDVDSFIAKIVISSLRTSRSRTACLCSQPAGFFLSEAWASVRLACQFAQTSPTRRSWCPPACFRLSCSKINEVRYSRTSFSSLDAGFDPTSLGTPTSTFDPGTGSSTSESTGGVFETCASGFSILADAPVKLSDSRQLHLNKGRHTIKFGGEYRRAQIDSFYGLSSAAFSPSVQPIPLACPMPCHRSWVRRPGRADLGQLYQGDVGKRGNTRRNTFNNGRVSSRRMTSGCALVLLSIRLRWEYFGPPASQPAQFRGDGNPGPGEMTLTVFTSAMNNLGPRAVCLERAA
jgi:hypothetical protein